MYLLNRTEVPPIMVSEIFDSTKSDDLSWRPTIFSGFLQIGSCGSNVGLFVARVWIGLGRMEAIDEVTDLRGFTYQGRQESLNFFLFA